MSAAENFGWTQLFITPGIGVSVVVEFEKLTITVKATAREFVCISSDGNNVEVYEAKKNNKMEFIMRSDDMVHALRNFGISRIKWRAAHRPKFQFSQREAR